MTSRFAALGFGAQDPVRLAGFWGGVLGRETAEDPDAPGGVVLLPNDDNEHLIRFLPSEAPKTRRNLVHFDLTSASPEAQQATAARALELGAQRIDVGQGPDADHVVLGDPEGNEFCVIEAGNAFLDGCGVIGAFVCDGSQEVGYFWSKALDWPLVWDRDQETAIRSPHGGSKITWGGPPVPPKAGGDRLRFDLAPLAGSDQRAEIDRLVSLGATRIGTGEGAYGQVVMADPDGYEFWVWPA